MSGRLWAGVLLGVSLRAADLSPVTVQIDRTALYAGDRIHYVARVEHPADVEFVQDDIRTHQLALDPFEVIESRLVSGTLPGGKRYFEVRLTLTTWVVGESEATVPSFNLFYFTKGQSNGEDAAPVEALPVPAVKVGLRSTMTDLPGTIRGHRPGLDLPRSRWIVPSVLGAAGLLVALICGCIVLLRRLRVHQLDAVDTHSQHPASVHDRLAEISCSVVATPEQAEIVYTHASVLIRNIVCARIGNCEGLTAGEIGAALREAGDSESRITVVVSLLEKCDLVRYSVNAADSIEGYAEFVRSLNSLVA